MNETASKPETPSASKVALITGASRGLGASLAVALAPTHHIVAVGRTVGALEEVDDRIRAAGGSATLAPMDITNEDAMAQLCRAVHDRWGGIDLWIHSAIEAMHLTPAADVNGKDWDKSVAVNVAATARLIAFVTPLMSDNSRAIFFHDDHAGEKFFGGYGATKAAQMALVESWRAENARIGPNIRVLHPKPLATAMRARFFPTEDRSKLASPDDEAARLLPEILA
ncbi:MAG: oxidoreductase [Rhodobacterales bacterium]|nr:MAG: oxidoreductase [Rhodobacterales bacterium]